MRSKALRIILANAMDYAVELGLLETNPIRALKWTAPKVSSQVDRRSVVNPQQARALLDAVHAQQPSGPRLAAFFAVMYYAGLRPEEAINLGEDNVTLPPLVWDEDSQQWQNPPDDEDWGRAAHSERNARCGRRMDRRREPAGKAAAQTPGRRRQRSPEAAAKCAARLQQQE